MSENIPVPGTQYLDWRVKSDYNTTAIRNAFRLFVRSITVVDCTANCDTVIYVWEISERQEVIPHEPSSIRDQILSIYIWWDFTEDLFKIADTLYTGMGDYTLSWNKMGPGYFKHVYDSVKADTNFFKGIDIAADYLAHCPQPLDLSLIHI